ncbi:MAG: hypothetical protein AAF934_07460 [Bacteroidota bacterium]
MKRLIQILFFCILIAVITGYFFKSNHNHLTGDRIIGLSVLALVFILMPLFIFHRYKKTNIRNYMFFNSKKEDEDKFTENQ